MLARLILACAARGGQRLIERTLAGADVLVGGSRPWDLRVHDERLFRRLLRDGPAALGDGYVDGWWDCADLDGFFTRILHAGVGRHRALRLWLVRVAARLLDQRLLRDAGSDPGRAPLEPPVAMLGSQRMVNCGHWQGAATLEEAQAAKIDLVCRTLAVTPGMRVLDLGCGWGAAARRIAERHGATVVGLASDPAQAAAARARCAGLPVTILDPGQQPAGRFARVVALGVVGGRDPLVQLDAVRRHLQPDGLLLLHAVAAERPAATPHGWFARPGLPAVRRLTAAVGGRFAYEDWHDCGADCQRTLVAWHARLEDAWARQPEPVEERTRRLWSYHLRCTAAALRARRNRLWQVVLSPTGRPARDRRGTGTAGDSGPLPIFLSHVRSPL